MTETYRPRFYLVNSNVGTRTLTIDFTIHSDEDINSTGKLYVTLGEDSINIWIRSMYYSPSGELMYLCQIWAAGAEDGKEYAGMIASPTDGAIRLQATLTGTVKRYAKVCYTYDELEYHSTYDAVWDKEQEKIISEPHGNQTIYYEDRVEKYELSVSFGGDTRNRTMYAKNLGYDSLDGVWCSGIIDINAGYGAVENGFVGGQFILDDGEYYAPGQEVYLVSWGGNCLGRTWVSGSYSRSMYDPLVSDICQETRSYYQKYTWQNNTWDNGINAGNGEIEVYGGTQKYIGRVEAPYIVHTCHFTDIAGPIYVQDDRDLTKIDGQSHSAPITGFYRKTKKIQTPVLEDGVYWPKNDPNDSVQWLSINMNGQAGDPFYTITYDFEDEPEEFPFEYSGAAFWQLDHRMYELWSDLPHCTDFDQFLSYGNRIIENIANNGNSMGEPAHPNATPPYYDNISLMYAGGELGNHPALNIRLKPPGVVAVPLKFSALPWDTTNCTVTNNPGIENDPGNIAITNVTAGAEIGWVQANKEIEYFEIICSMPSNYHYITITIGQSSHEISYDWDAIYWDDDYDNPVWVDYEHEDRSFDIAIAIATMINDRLGYAVSASVTDNIVTVSPFAGIELSISTFHSNSFQINPVYKRANYIRLTGARFAQLNWHAPKNSELIIAFGSKQWKIKAEYDGDNTSMIDLCAPHIFNKISSQIQSIIPYELPLDTSKFSNGIGDGFRQDEDKYVFDFPDRHWGVGRLMEVGVQLLTPSVTYKLKTVTLYRKYPNDGGFAKLIVSHHSGPWNDSRSFGDLAWREAGATAGQYEDEPGEYSYSVIPKANLVIDGAVVFELIGAVVKWKSDTEYTITLPKLNRPVDSGGIGYPLDDYAEPFSYGCNGVFELNIAPMQIGASDPPVGTDFIRNYGMFVSNLVGGIYNVDSNNDIDVPIRILPLGWYTKVGGKRIPAGSYHRFRGAVTGLVTTDDGKMVYGGTVTASSPNAPSGHKEIVSTQTNKLGWYQSAALCTIGGPVEVETQGSSPEEIQLRSRMYSRCCHKGTRLVLRYCASNGVLVRSSGGHPALTCCD